MRSLLVSTYEMGRQPFGIASAAAWMRAAGWEVSSVDVAKERLDEERLAAADLIAFHLPMHTATRLASPIIATARRVNRAAHICAFGLYAPLNAEWVRSLGADAVFGGEFEEDLAAFANHARSTQHPQNVDSEPCSAGSADFPFDRRDAPLPKIHFLVPDRTGLPPLSTYATLQMPGGRRRLVGYTEASRGTRPRCARRCSTLIVTS